VTTHRIVGTAGLFGLAGISDLAHEAELLLKATPCDLPLLRVRLQALEAALLAPGADAAGIR
jgi:hypothetical protein